MKLDWSRKVGESIANQVILPKDQVEAVAIEATRQQIIELQSIISGEDIPVSPRDNDIMHIQTIMEKLFPLISSAPAGSMPPEMVKPLQSAVQHFIAHVQNAEAKGADKKQIAEYKKAVSEAINYLTAGQAPISEGDLFPAATGGGGGGGGRRPSTAQATAMGEAVGTQNPSQNNAVNQVAAPPKPVTAG
jgi:hypothetical protein